MKKRILLTLAALVSLIPALAQSSIGVQAPNVVAVDEQFNVTFVIEGENSPSEFDWSAGDDFQIVWGPQKGSSTSTIIVNGKRSRTSQSTYTYVLLPRSTGTFTLPAAQAVVKGETIRSQRTSIEVVSNGSSSRSQQQSSGSSSQSSGQSSSGEVSGEDLFLRLTLSRTNVVVGEPITATLKLYQRVSIAGFEDARFPSFTGFWSQEVQAPTNIDFQRESLGDRIYNSAVLRSWTLIPQQAGDISIEPAELVCLVNIRTSSSPMSIFDSFFQDDYRTIRKQIKSSGQVVHVAKLPAGAPSSFGGGVGTYSIKAQVTRDSLQTHDAASLIVTVTGRGNVSLLEAPTVAFPPDFEVYDTKVTDSVDKSGGSTSGSKKFEYPFIPRSHGDFTIPPVEYSYYDVSAGRYVTLTTDPIVIKVARGNESEPSTTGIVSSGTVRKDVRSLGSDIRFISTEIPSLSRQGSFFLFSTGFWIAFFLLLLAATACYFALRGMAARRADVVGTRNRQATKMAQKRLSAAGGYLKNNLYAAFYEELHRALLGFISDKLNLDAADMSKDRIAEELTANGVGTRLSDSFVSLLDACEFARYAPDAGHEAMSAHYDSAVSVISSIDSSMKKKSSTSERSALILIAALLLLPLSGRAAAHDAYLDSLWVNGTAAYADGQWDTARESWDNIAAVGVESPELYYNLGNACFKLGDYAHAILNYERALKLNPSYGDARFNLQYANEFVQDKIDTVPEFFLAAWARKMCWLLPSDIWAVLFFVFLAAALSCLLIFLLSSRRVARRASFYSGIAAMLLVLVCLLFSHWQWSDYRQADQAVVVRAVTSVKSSPGTDSSKDLFILHEGTKVTILDSVGSWLNVELADGRQGWLPGGDVEII